MSTVLSAIGALLPPVGVGVIFWLVMRWILQADRRERAAIARLDAAERDVRAGARSRESRGSAHDSVAPTADE
jgi:hypothetical protein